MLSSTLALWVDCLRKTESQSHFLLHDPPEEPFLLGYLKEISITHRSGKRVTA